MQNAAKDNKILVSFIIPYYNLPVEMLRQCIESILALTLSSAEREIIVIDDGSDESPINQLGDYIDEIIYVRQKNGGVSVARNTGMMMAQGEYIQLIDGDDMLIRSAYEHCLDFARFTKPDMVVYDFTTTPGDTVSQYADDQPTSGVDYLQNNNIYGSFLYLFKRSIRGSLTFRPGVVFTEDEEFTPQLIVRADTLQHTTAKAYYYRKHAASVTQRQDKRHIAKHINDEIGTILNLRKIADTLPTRESQAMQRRVAQLTMNHIYNVIVNTRSSHQLERCIEQLSAKGLFPLPDKDYTVKYKWFRKLTNTKMGRLALLRTLPLIGRER